MKSIYLFCISLLMLISCSDDSTGPDTEKGTIKGFVYSASTNERISDAFIYTEPLTSSMKTGIDGSFMLNNIDPGNYILVVSKEGYKTFRNEIKVSNNITNNLQIPLDSLPKEVEISNLIGHWKLDNSPLDSGPNSYPGFEENVTYVKDRNGLESSAASFNGISTGYRSLVTSSPIIQLSTLFSISFWINPASSLGRNADSYYDCISKWGGSSFEAASYAVGITNESKLFFNTYDNKGNRKLFKSSIDIPIGTWTNVTLTFQNGIAKIYINGVLNSSAGGFPIPQYSTIPFTIGARSDNLSSFHGSIDDVYLYDKILTDLEIMELAK